MSVRVIHYTSGSENLEIIQAIWKQINGNIYQNNANPPQGQLNHYLNFDFVYNEDFTGCVVLYICDRLILHSKKALALGHFECMNDKKVAAELFEKAKTLARDYEVSYLIGPMNGSTWDTYRYTKGENGNPFFMEYQHAKYYPELWLQSGFSIVAEYLSQLDSALELYEEEKMQRIRLDLETNGVKIRNLSLDNFEEEIKKVYRFCLKSFAENFLYTDISWDHFYEKYFPLKNIADPELLWVAENSQREIVGLLFAIKDFLNLQNDQVIVKTVARLPNREYAGIIHLLSNEFVKTSRAKGFRKAIHAYMYMSNKSKNLSSHFQGVPFRYYQLFYTNV